MENNKLSGKSIWAFVIIFIALIFVIIYFVMNQKSNVEPEQNEVEQIAETNTDNAVEETETTMEFITDKTKLAEAEKLFSTECSVCHLKDAGGQVGPNLVDGNWIYGCTVDDITTIIKDGTQKGMLPFKDKFSDQQILELASYINSLKGSTPSNPKAAEGEPCTP